MRVCTSWYNMHRDLKHQTDNDVARIRTIKDSETVVLMVARTIEQRGNDDQRDQASYLFSFIFRLRLFTVRLREGFWRGGVRGDD